jgi:hypothetical protein
MKKIFPTLALLIAMLSFTSCAIQQEIEIVKERKQKTEHFVHQRQTVKDGVFSKNRKLRTRHRYFYHDVNGKWYFRPTPLRKDFIHYKRTGGVKGTGGKVRVIKRATVAKPAK